MSTRTGAAASMAVNASTAAAHRADLRRRRSKRSLSRSRHTARSAPSPRVSPSSSADPSLPRGRRPSRPSRLDRHSGRSYDTSRSPSATGPSRCAGPLDGRLGRHQPQWRDEPAAGQHGDGGALRGVELAGGRCLLAARWLALVHVHGRTGQQDETTTQSPHAGPRTAQASQSMSMKPSSGGPAGKPGRPAAGIADVRRAPPTHPLSRALPPVSHARPVTAAAPRRVSAAAEQPHEGGWRAVPWPRGRAPHQPPRCRSTRPPPHAPPARPAPAAGRGRPRCCRPR